MQTASWVFVSLLVVFLIAVIGVREFAPKQRAVDPNTHMLLGLLCALLAGLATFFMTGDIAVQFSGNESGVAVKAVGGVGLFVLVLWWWRQFPLLPIQGPGSPMASTVTAFDIIDKIYPELKAVIRREAHATAKPYSVFSKFEDGALVFIRRGQQGEKDFKIEQISPDDFKNLPKEDADFLIALRDSIDDLYQRWLKLFPRRATNPAVENELREIAKKLCQDLEMIFRHLGNKRYVLEDHYGAVRSICQELERAPT